MQSECEAHTPSGEIDEVREIRWPRKYDPQMKAAELLVIDDRRHIGPRRR
jgi:hypothetical protein